MPPPQKVLRKENQTSVKPSVKVDTTPAEGAFFTVTVKTEDDFAKFLSAWKEHNVFSFELYFGDPQSSDPSKLNLGAKLSKSATERATKDSESAGFPRKARHVPIKGIAVCWHSTFVSFVVLKHLKVL
jgi:hypothetical protein